jgi:hypothetical protein
MANQPDVGNGLVVVGKDDVMTLEFMSHKGPVLALSYQLYAVGDPPKEIERNGWNDLDFQKKPTRIWRLKAIEGSPGRYMVVVHASLLDASASMTVTLVRGTTVEYRRTIPGALRADESARIIFINVDE